MASCSWIVAIASFPDATASTRLTRVLSGSLQDLARGGVVVDDEDAEPGQLLWNDPSCTRRRSHADPHREVERRPGAGLAFEPDAASHQVDQAAADGQAKTGAAMLSRRGHVGLRERLKQLRRLLGRHADPGIAHGALELHLLAGPLDQLDVEPNLAALGELHGVVDEVGQDLPQTQRIAEQMFRDPWRDVR